MSLKKFFRDYFYFSRRDRIGIIALVVMILLVYLLPVYFPAGKDELEIQQGSFLARAMDSLEANQTTAKPYSNPRKEDDRVMPATVFDFNPNTLDEKGWTMLGLSPRIARTILRYRSKGGQFHQPGDLKKIWGLPEDFYEKVKDHIVLPRISKKVNDTSQFISTSPEPHKPFKVSINEADTSAFIALPGIGSKLAQRIILYREKTGGFYSIDQISEIYGLKNSTFQLIRPFLQITGTVKKFKLNSVTRDELKVHPYFKWNLANAIVSYREQHGPFQGLEELKNISVIDEKTFEKIVHYLER
jgi:competence ComEA-like helix-hairpin-helix protein